MLIGFLTVVMMGVVGYAFWREGPLTALAMCCNTILSGIIAFNFWEPIASAIASPLSKSFLAGTEDALVLMALFCGSLALLRWLTNTLASTDMLYPTVLYRGGALVFGLATGYFAAGFLVCALQTLPWEQEFLTFETYEPGRSSPLRRVMPPDLVWLASMHRLSGGGLERERDRRFDKNGNFELRYLRYRRVDDKGVAMPARTDLVP